MNSTETENKYSSDDEYETETIVKNKIIDVSKKLINEPMNKYDVELDVSKYPKTKAGKRVVAHVSLKS